jgi:hypothetical protein
MMSTSQPFARQWAAGMDAVAVLPPPVPAAMNRCRQVRGGKGRGVFDGLQFG